jgi:deoxyribodipyrimidine photo-lyase
MAKTYKRALHIFRRDLRLEDNTALRAASSSAEEQSLAFIFDPRQVDANPYRSNNALLFMLNSLNELKRCIEKKGGRLFFFYDSPGDVLRNLLKDHDALFLNNDYTPFSLKRDKTLKKLCDEMGSAFHSFDDALLNPPHKVLKSDGTPYTVFTPFYKSASKLEVLEAKPVPRFNFSKLSYSFEDQAFLEKLKPEPNSSLYVKGGRKEALKLINNLEKFKNYNDDRNFPALEATTKLSAHNKFGTISVRELYHKLSDNLGQNHGLIRQLYWRDFFTQIAFHFPHVFKGAFKEQYNNIKWQRSRKDFEQWCAGETGFPIVDAGMRQLNRSGYMHNRVRMIVASFLVKDLHLNWQWGERYFATKLVDYDPAVNNGSWQWAASTGCDAQPYFRIFNPWLQQKKFDPEAVYIKKWIPELEALSADKIHNWLEQDSGNIKYPSPMLDHHTAKEYAQEMFARAGK